MRIACFAVAPDRGHCVAPNRGMVPPLTGAMGDGAGDGPTELMSLSGHVVRCNGPPETKHSRMAPKGPKLGSNGGRGVCYVPVRDVRKTLIQQKSTYNINQNHLIYLLP